MTSLCRRSAGRQLFSEFAIKYFTPRTKDWGRARWPLRTETKSGMPSTVRICSPSKMKSDVKFTASVSDLSPKHCQRPIPQTLSATYPPGPVPACQSAAFLAHACARTTILPSSAQQGTCRLCRLCLLYRQAVQAGSNEAAISNGRGTTGTRAA